MDFTGMFRRSLPPSGHPPPPPLDSTMKSPICPDLLTLNVGGSLFQTTFTTVFSMGKETFLAKLLLGEEQKRLFDQHGNIFIDRDPQTFSAVLQFLRCNGTTGFLESESDYVLRLLIDEALFYQYPELARDATMELERREKKKKMISFPQLIEILNMKIRTSQLRRLTGVCFYASDLYGVEFESCNMHCCNFEKSNLSKCRFIRCNLEGTNFSKTILKDALFEKCDLLQTDFSDADVSGVVWKYGKCVRCKLEGMRSTHFVLHGIEMDHMDFRVCNPSTLSSMKFVGYEYEGRESEEVNVLRVLSVEHLTLVGVSFTGCRLLDCAMEKCRFINCCFDDCDMGGTDVSMSHFVDCSLARVKVFEGCDLRGTVFSHTFSDTGSKFKDIKIGEFALSNGTTCETTLP
eukprot:TRINITY_DN2104_c0_g1_i2.p1 TRINITY_DN2104_c0_g1~~TRINITY_DN2104_c0_g1_i2.p1  ORF type:complete len:404 (+),score=87.56 TRINITY_DN2104_c0_g1_i2:743-1954(+)